MILTYSWNIIPVTTPPLYEGSFAFTWPHRHSSWAVISVIQDKLLMDRYSLVLRLWKSWNSLHFFKVAGFNCHPKVTFPSVLSLLLPNFQGPHTFQRTLNSTYIYEGFMASHLENIAFVLQYADYPVFFLIYWSRIALQCYVNFCYIAKWVHSTCTYDHSFLDSIPM